MKGNQATTCAILFLGSILPLHAAQPLSDLELDEITAGTASAVYEDGRVYFDLNRTTARGTRIGASGDAEVNVGSVAVNTGTLQLLDGAQGNLRALVNTNAVNSAVQVLINLNININSHVDVLNQLNNTPQ